MPCQHILLLAGAEHLLSQLTVKIPLGKAAAGKDCRHQIHICLLPFQRLLKLADCRRNIFRALHPALDFKGIYPQLHQLLHPMGKAEVLERKGIAAVALATAGKRQAAGLCAQSAVAAALPNHRAHITLTGHTHTQRTVYKHFGFNLRLRGNRSDLRPAHLAGKHHAGKSQLLCLQCTRQIVDSQLGGSVHRHLGRCLAHQRSHSQILHNQRVDAVAAGNLQSAHHLLILPVVHHRVDRHVHLDAALFTDAGSLLQRILVKIFCVAAGV